MRRIIVFTLLALTLGGGVALADRDHYRRGDNRGDRRSDYRGDRRSDYRGDHRGIRNPNDPVWHQRHRQPGRVVHRRPVYVNNGYYHFHDGRRFRYSRPVVHTRYYDYRVRPRIIVENYEQVPGYVWVAGQWQWNGYEWLWVSGHYAIDPSYDDGIRY